ncbi:MAG: nitroreductase [Christensenellaceae bacterium]|jgi:hypothetical protein|nr:nitroreductase [Christensenellaceae bacterium]
MNLLQNNETDKHTGTRDLLRSNKTDGLSETQDLYEAIFIRRSVRKYNQTALDEKTLADIKNFLNNTKQIGGCEACFEFVESGTVGNGKAPHYILAYCKNEAAEYINVGYTLQNVDLYLQSKGLGSVWLGMAKPKDTGKREDYCIMLAFGKTNVPPRKGAGDFKRLKVSEISNENNAVAEAARLAPSAMNTQPYKLNFESGKITVEYFGRGIMKAIIKKRMGKIDMGIVMRHIQVALENQGKAVTNINIKKESKKLYVEILYT